MVLLLGAGMQGKAALFDLARSPAVTEIVGTQMLASGQIRRRGRLSPTHYVPFTPFLADLERRGILVAQSED